jgi:hypothetical protein
MPEIKQNFIKGKMNKDLDERLIPKGEYREAQNIHITESEGSDVGAIENIIGNVKLGNNITPTLPIRSTPGNTDTSEYEVIGYCEDLSNDRVVYFVTNFSSTSYTDNIRSIDRAWDYDFNDDPSNYGCAIILYDIKEDVYRTLCYGTFLNFSKNHLITGVQIIEDLLFWTDNLNQPRKINIKTALDNGHTYYNREETISLAKYAPYKPIMLHSDDGVVGISRNADVESEYLKERFVRFSYRYKYSDGEYSLIAPFTQSVFEPLNKGIITNSLTDDEINETSGEPQVLTGKKEVYKKGIVDIMQNRINKIIFRIPLPNKNEFTTTPYSTGVYENPFHIDEVEILLKESNGISFKSIKSVKIKDLKYPSDAIESYTVRPVSSGSPYQRQCLKYEYTSGEPTKVLPESEINRVTDQVPVLAKAMDIAGNRVIFGNYVENYEYPKDNNGRKGINYNVESVTKGTYDLSGGIDASEPYLDGLKQWMHRTYKYHTVKQRRTYQVGIVFCDIFGRQSPVILSSNELPNADTITVGAVNNTFEANADGAWSSNDAFGKSLAIGFLEKGISGDDKFVADMNFGPGATYLDATGGSYNPHGWYSYRLVVKQQQQDYYNVYTPHPFDGWDNIKESPQDSLTGGRSWLSLHGDNINKIPRSLNSNDTNRPGTMGSDVRLFPKIIFDSEYGGIKLGDIGITNAGSGIAESGSPYTKTIGDSGVTYSGSGVDAQFKIIVDATETAISVEVLTTGKGFKTGETISFNLGGASDVVITLTKDDLYYLSGESKLNSSSTELLEVISLGNAYEQNLFMSGDDNNSGTGGFTVFDFVYGKNKNPLVAEVKNMKAYIGSNSNNKSFVYYAKADTSSSALTIAENQQGDNATYSDDDLNYFSLNVTSPKHNEQITVLDSFASSGSGPYVTLSSNQSIAQGDKLVFSKYYEGLSVFETEPFESKIEIYYETSTSGLLRDLVEEVDASFENLPTGFTLKQDDYSTGVFADQYPLPELIDGDANDEWGDVIYVYENTPSGTYVGDLSATLDPTSSGTLSFSLSRATFLASGASATELFEVELDPADSTWKLKTDAIMPEFKNNNEDIVIVKINAIDSEFGSLSKDFKIKIRNSKPAFESTPTEGLAPNLGINNYVVLDGLLVNNGSLVTTGVDNNRIGISMVVTMANSDYNSYFDGDIKDGEITIRTTSNWNDSAIEAFFNDSIANRTMTITILDEYGAEKDISFPINEVTESFTSSQMSYNDGDYTLYWVAQNTGPELIPWYLGIVNDNNKFVNLDVGHVIFTDLLTSSETAPAGTYKVLEPGATTYRLATVNSDGLVTSVIKNIEI